MTAIGPGVPDDGFHEILAVVLDLDASLERLCAVFGYQRLWRGAVDRVALDLLELESEARGEEALIGDPTQGRGLIRLLALEGTHAGVMRDGAQPWDVGGLFDIDVYALNPIEALHRRMTTAGFCAFAPITAYDFVGLSVKQVVARDADGLAVALIERVAPPLVGFAGVEGAVSYVFNTTQVVPSLDAARAFYTGVLGWSPVHETSWTHPDGLNCLGLPLDVARERTLRVGIFQARGALRGAVECLEVAGEGRDYAAAAPPDRGWAALRFPMADVAGFLARAASGGCRVLPARNLEIAPYGRVEAGVAITPWGVRLEAYRCL